MDIKIQLALAKGKKDIDKRRKITDKRVRKEIRDLNNFFFKLLL